MTAIVATYTTTITHGPSAGHVEQCCKEFPNLQSFFDFTDSEITLHKLNEEFYRCYNHNFKIISGWCND